ncbi:MAG: hypothetical protein KAX49_00175 [Halanaerobiales bacterium]|nr:hypothetical protein [Halanaerobiales bacterium]
MYQSLKEIGKAKDYEKLKGYLKLVDYVTIGIAGTLGGYIAYKYGLVMNYWLSLFGIPIAVYLSLTLYEKEVAQKNRQKSNFIKHISQSLKVININKSIGFVIIYGGLTGAILYGQIHEMTSLTYIPLYLFGYIGFTTTLLGGLGGIFASKLKERFDYNSIFRGILILSTAFIYLFSLSTHWWGIIFIICAILVLEIVSPLTSGYIHQKSLTNNFPYGIINIEYNVLNINYYFYFYYNTFYQIKNYFSNFYKY